MALESEAVESDLALASLQAAMEADGRFPCSQRAIDIPERESDVGGGSEPRDAASTPGAPPARIGPAPSSLPLGTVSPLAWAGRALELDRIGALEEALAAAECLAAAEPDRALGWALLAHLRARRGDHEAALVLGRRALAVEPGDPVAQYNLGVSLQALGRLEEAVSAYREVLATNNRHRGALVNLGACLRRLGRAEEAIRLWRSALASDPDCAELRFNLSCALLQSGAWADGWAGYEERWAVHGWRDPVPASHAPRWNGESIAGRLLVVCEQGLGDTIQFLRLLPRLTGRVEHVTLVCPRRLHRLLARSPAVGACPRFLEAPVLWPDDVQPPPADAWVPLLSLPGLLGLEPETIGADVPYLRAEPDLVSRWRARLDARCPRAPGQLRIGLVWQGNPHALAEQGRSVPLAALRPLAAVSGIRLVSLQKGAGREQLAAAGSELIAADLGPELDEGPDAFVDTAALLQSLDLVVTSDTSIAHLAGALGRPVWMLLKQVPDWRWPTEDSRTPWYPTMRLFHQTKAGDWDGAVERLAEALRELVELRAELRTAGRSSVSFADATAAHREGRLQDAIAGYRSLLAGDPDQPPLLHLLAVARLSADGLRPPEPPQPLALASWAAELAPRDPDVHANFGLLLKAAGRPREAEAALRHSLSLTAWAHGPAAVNLVNLLLDRGPPERAVAAAERACTAASSPDRLAALARALQRADRLDAAAETWRRVVAIEPRRADAWIGLGSVLHALGRSREAAGCFDRALGLEPDHPDALTNLGVLERRLGQAELAVWYHRRAVELHPRHLAATTNLGATLLDVGRIDEGIEVLRRAIRIAPDHADAHMALGMALLLQGRFEEGLEEYEWRLETALAQPSTGPRCGTGWDGRRIEGLRFLLLAEQGFGDALQFVRYAALLKALGAASVLVGCRAPLARLLSRATGVDGVVVEGQSLPPVDTIVHLMSLPHRLGTRLETIPAPIPYLSAEPELLTAWAERLSEKPGLRVGLAWQGNPDPRVDHGRSIPLAAFAPLAAIPELRLIALQKGPGREQVAEAARLLPVELLVPEPDDGPDAFVDTAAIMMNLDLVVTTDTAIAHLAGALGRPVWLLLKHPPEWRWLLDRQTSPWYPTMRLFRQAAASAGDDPWAPVIARLASELERLAQGDRSALLPGWTSPDPVGRGDEPSPADSAEPVELFERAFHLHRSGKIDAAQRCYAELLERQSEHLEALHMLGVCALQRDAPGRALAFLARARALGLRSPEHASNLALALKALDRRDEAEAELRAALDARPDFTEARVNLANLLSETDRPDAALEVLRPALDAARPGPAVWRALGNLQLQRGEPEDAIYALSRARDLVPDDPEIRLDLAHALLAAGHLREGFCEYEWRWRSRSMQPRVWEVPAWDGWPFPGRTLLLHGEQGLGDHIMLARFLPTVARSGGRVLFECRAELHGLLRAAFSDIPNLAFLAQGGPLPPFDMHLALASLPHVLGVDLASIPDGVPYLRADEQRVARWRARLGEKAGLRVGLVWQGNPGARADRGRSIPLERLEPVLERPGIEFVALQKEHGLDQLQRVAGRFRIRHPGPDFDTGPDAFLDSAALLSCLDLVVTTDTALAHLAGALARPTWLLLKHAPDWRWLTRRTDSPWYPTMRLYRQPRPGDWDSVVHEVAQDLEALVAARDVAAGGIA